MKGSPPFNATDDLIAFSLFCFFIHEVKFIPYHVNVHFYGNYASRLKRFSEIPLISENLACSFTDNGVNFSSAAK